MILMYHRISDRRKTEGSCTGVYAFVCDMLRLRKYHVVGLDDYDPTDPEQAVITFDDGYLDVWQNAVPLLRRLNYPFEVFVVTDFLENKNCMNRNLLANLCQQTKGRLQFHGNKHLELADVWEKEKIQQEMRVPEDVRLLDPKGFRWFAYPFCSYNEQVLNEAHLLYLGAVSGKGLGSDDIYALERLKITDKSDRRQIFPALTLREYLLSIVWYLQLKLIEIFRKR